ncbi:MAG: hypothetical protein IJQ89_08715 [Bacteroidales bacterium]|nr:hypothetical protein [Bacteroidales bacterium]
MKKLTLIIGLVATVFLLITACTKEKEKAPKPYDFRTQWVGQYYCTGYTVDHQFIDTAHLVNYFVDQGLDIHLTAHNANDSLLIGDIRQYVIIDGEREYGRPLSVEFKVNTLGNFFLTTHLGKWLRMNGFFYDNDSIFFTITDYYELVDEDPCYDTGFFKGVRVSRQ